MLKKLWQTVQVTVHGWDHDQVLGFHELKSYDDGKMSPKQTGMELGKQDDIARVQALNDCISSRSAPFVEGDETWQVVHNAADANGEERKQ